jgi:hypothetical protein
MPKNTQELEQQPKAKPGKKPFTDRSLIKTSVSVALSPAIREKLDELALLDNCSRSQIITNIIENFFEKRSNTGR